MMKKILAGILAALLSVSILAGCGSESSSSAVSEPPPASESSVPEPEVSTPESAEEPEEEPVDDSDEGNVFEGPGILSMVDYSEDYKKAADQQGTVEAVTYNNGTEDKYFHIYLPYGYESGSDNYNVLYMMHGGNGRPEVYLQPGHATAFQSLMDHMILNGEIDPIIVVATTWNSEVAGASPGDLTDQFAQTEFTENVLPLVDGNYRTNATRDSRAFSGFSMGGVTTWFNFLYNLDEIRYFAPISGDCWAMGQQAGGTQPEETAAALADAVTSQGYTADDFLIYCTTGTEDTALPNLAPQINAMQENEMFEFGENTFFGVWQGGEHTDVYGRKYLYNVLPNFWKD